MSNDVLTLRDAVELWCDADLLEEAKVVDRRYSETDIESATRPRLTHRTEWREPSNTSWMGGRDSRSWLAMWQALENDLRQRIERGLIHLRGVQLAPDRRTAPETIPGVWAADILFDFKKGTIKIGQHRFGAIVCSKVAWADVEPPATIPAPPATPQPIATILKDFGPENLPDLNDKLVLDLLEEHGRRVVANGGQLIIPGKVSLMPLFLAR